MSTHKDPVVQRRRLLAAAPATLLAMGGGCAAENPPIQRIVTTQRGDGPVEIVAEGAPPVAFELNGSTITRLWETRQVPAPLPFTEDATLTAGRAYAEGFTGTSFYLADIPAGSSIEDIPIHRNETVDYIAVLFGKIVLVLPNREIPMGPGDCLVQGGNAHTWVNRTDDLARLLVVVVTGRAESGGDSLHE